MPPQKNITVCANGGGVLADRLKLALAVANRLGCDIQVLAFQVARPSPSLDHDFLGTDAEHEVLRSTWDHQTEALNAWRATYEHILGPQRLTKGASPISPVLSVRWTDVFQSVRSGFPSFARACDIIVAGAHSEDPDFSTLDDEVSAIALLESGRLALFAVHPTPDVPDVFQKVIIAWDDGPAAARVIAQAIPIIAAAASVCLFIVETDPQRSTPCNEILAYLRQYAPNTTVTSVTAVLHSAGHMIVKEAESWEASLIVMGAYEHSRGREIVFGGTTRFVIDHAKCPILIAK